MEFVKNIPLIFRNNTSKLNVKFISTDDKNLFLNNREKFGNNWYYYEKEVTYKYNSWGYRSKEFKDIKNDYILVFGCSYTEGIGLHYDDMWSTKIGETLKMDIFNLGAGGTGPDYQFINTSLFVNFLLKNKKFPKYVIYQWPFNHRVSFGIYQDTKLYNESFSITYPKKVYPPNYKEYIKWYKSGYIENKGEMIRSNNINIMMCNNIWKSLNIPTYNWTWDDDFTLEEKDIFNNDHEIINIIDNTEILARDNTHNGHLSQDLVVNEFLKYIEHGISK
jgi:hypothetical protein